MGSQSNRAPAQLTLLLTPCPKPDVGSRCAVPTPVCTHKAVPISVPACLLLRWLTAPWHPAPQPGERLGGCDTPKQARAIRPRLSNSDQTFLLDEEEKELFLAFHLVLSRTHTISQFLPELQLYRDELAFSIFSRTRGVIHYFFF